jgi:hypothetical protein
MAAVSSSSLNQLYSAFSSTKDSGVSAQDRVINYFNVKGGTSSYNEVNYAAMATAINNWLCTKPLGYTPKTSGLATNSGLRVQVIEADGKTAFDSNASTITDNSGTLTAVVNKNLLYNIHVPASGWNTLVNKDNGKELINENQVTRSYNMGAFLAQSGTFYQIKYSASTGKPQMYIAVRQGLSSADPLGNVVISLDTSA